MLCEPQRLTNLYLEVLRDHLGVPAQPTEDGDIVFDVNGGRYVVRNFAPQDPEFLVVSLVFKLDHAAGSAQTLLSVANDVNTQACGAHVVIDGDCAVIACEMLTAGPDCVPSAVHLAAILPRCVSALALTAQRFFVDLELAGIAAGSAA